MEQIDWGWNALNKLTELERRVAELERRITNVAKVGASCRCPADPGEPCPLTSEQCRFRSRL